MANNPETKFTEDDIDTLISYLKYNHINLADGRRHSDPKAHHSKKCLDCLCQRALPGIRVLKQTAYFETDEAKKYRAKDTIPKKSKKTIDK